MVFNILGTFIEFNDDLKYFVDTLFGFEDIRDEVIYKVKNEIKNNKIDEALRDIDKAFKKMNSGLLFNKK